MKASVISDYRLAALQESPQALRPCIVHQGKSNLPLIARLLQCSVRTQSAHGARGAADLSRGRRKNPKGFGSRFGELNGDFFSHSNGVSSTFNQGVHIRAGVGIGPDDSSSFEGESKDGGQASVWGSTAGSRNGLLEAANKFGDYFRNMMTNTNKKRQGHMDNTTSSTTEEKENEPESVETNWKRWQKVFVETEERGKLASMLVLQLEEAVEKEQFREAAVLKEAIAELSSNDAVSEVMKELKRALVEERYVDAANLHDKAGAGLVGWWLGTPESGDDSYGHIIHISAAQGRFVAKSYNAKQLTTGEEPEAPLFEVFVTKIRKNNYSLQAVYLKQEGNVSSDTDTSDMIVDAPEGLQPNILEFVSTPPDTDHDRDGSRTGADEDRIFKNLQDQTTDDNTVGSRNNDNNVEKQESQGTSIQGLITGAMQNSLDETDVMAPVRIPANLERKTKDLFTFHFREVYRPGSWRSKIARSESICGRAVLNVEKGSMGDQLSSGTVISKVATEMAKIARHAVTQARRSQHLAEMTSFHRINTLETGSNSDPFSGLYVGDFGLNTSHLEVVQLRRKFGNWGENKDQLEFFQYVEAVKLIGDLDFPTGEVLFRAKVGERSRLRDGLFPAEFGGAKGQGKMAERGSKIRHTQWFDGELLHLDPKSASRMKGSELGFVYSVHERPSLVLFNRLKLQDWKGIVSGY